VIPVLLSMLLLSGGTFPPRHETAWMRPDAFHLGIGMTRTKAESALRESHWTLRDGKKPGQLIVEYDEQRTVTLEFADERLVSIRFELVDFIPKIRAAFAVQKEALIEGRGKPDRETEELLIYDQTMPEIYVVVSTRHDTSFGKQGLGFLAVRYFLPSDRNERR